MFNDFFYKENYINILDKCFDCTNNFLSQISQKNYKKTETTDNYIFTINDTKTDFFNSKNMQDMQHNISEEEIWNKIFSQKKKKEQDEDSQKNFSPFDVSYKSINSKNIYNKENNSKLYNNKNSYNDKNENNINDTLKNLNDNNDNITISHDNNSENSNYFFQIDGNKILFNGSINSLLKNFNDHNKDIFGDINKYKNISSKPNKSNTPKKTKRGPYKKVRLDLDKIDVKDKCFPFKTGKGILNMDTKFNFDYFEEYLE